MTDSEKFEYQMCTTTDLAYFCQRAVEHERTLRDELKHKSIDDNDYDDMVKERAENKSRIKYLKKCLKERQLSLF